MKKLLALVLALVMTLGLATVGTNAAFTDQAAVDASDFEEAITVLNGMKVFKGDENGNFNPTALIDRASVAAIIYRIYTGDVNDKQASIYAGYGNFDDVKSTDWFAGYVGYCANAGFIKGDGNGHFYPNAQVTGYQALAMILRAVGYDANGEFTGSDWELHVAQTAQQLGIVKNVSASTLKSTADRQTVAELLFETVAYVPTVTYMPAFGYVSGAGVGELINMGKTNEYTLGWKNFKLDCDDTHFDNAKLMDKWGRPAVKWFKSNAAAPTQNIAQATSTIYGTFPIKAAYTTNVETDKCDVFDALGLSSAKTVARTEHYINGMAYDVDYNGNVPAVTIKDTAKESVGAQGRQVEFYWVDGALRMVEIDTYLAQVTKVVDIEKDKNGHETDAELYLDVYFADAEEFADRTDADATLAGLANKTREASPVQIVLTDDTNWEYAKGDWVLVNVHEYNDDDDVDFSNNDKSDVLGKAKSLAGAQETIYRNTAHHDIDGKKYNDAVMFDADDAGNDGSVKYTWFFDQFGNVIGDAYLASEVNYGVITYIERIEQTKKNDTLLVDLVLMDGTKLEDQTVSALTFSQLEVTGKDGNGNDIIENVQYTANGSNLGGDGSAFDDWFDTNAKNNNWFLDDDLYQIGKNAKGEMVLTEVDEYLATKKIDRIGGELTEADVVAKNPAIDGADTGIFDNAADAQNRIKVDSATKFLYRTGDAHANYKYTAITGVKNITSLDLGSAQVDWVDVNGDGYAEYVYYYGNITASDTYSFVYVSKKASSSTVKENNGVKYYNMLGAVDMKGEAAEIKVKVADKDDVLDVLVDGVGQLFKITTNGGYVTAVENVGTKGTPGSRLGTSSTYAIVEDRLEAHGNVIKYKVGNGTLDDTDTGNIYDVEDAVVIKANGTVGGVSDLKKLDGEQDDTYVYVVYTRKSTGRNQFDATTVIISNVEPEAEVAVVTNYEVSIPATDAKATITTADPTYQSGDGDMVIGVKAKDGYVIKSISADCAGYTVEIADDAKTATVTFPKSVAADVELTVNTDPAALTFAAGTGMTITDDELTANAGKKIDETTATMDISDGAYYADPSTMGVYANAWSEDGSTKLTATVKTAGSAAVEKHITSFVVPEGYTSVKDYALAYLADRQSDTNGNKVYSDADCTTQVEDLSTLTADGQTKYYFVDTDEADAVATVWTINAQTIKEAWVGENDTITLKLINVAGE